MPFQPINFANIPLQRNPIANLPQLLAQGFQAAQLPADAQRAANRDLREQKSSDIANALKSMQMQKAKMDIGQQQSFMDAMRQYQTGNNAPDEGLALRQSLMDSQGAYRKPEDGYYGASADSSDTKPGQAGHPEPPVVGERDAMQVIDKGDPKLHWVDQMYSQNPQWRNMLEQRGFKLKRDVKHSPETGEMFETITYPSGKIESRAIDVGRSPESVVRGKELAKADSKVYSNALDGQQAASQIGSTLNYLNNVVTANPEAQNAIGPVNNVLTRFFGKEETQDILGAVNGISANLMQEMASGFKGAFTGREQSLITNSKPNAKDPWNVFVGKLNTLRQLTDLSEKRNRLISENYHKGMPASDAIDAARKATDMTPFFQEVQRRPEKVKVSAELITPENIKFTAQKYGLSEEQVRQRLGG